MVFAWLAAIWILARLLPPAANDSPAALAAAESARVVESPDSGRFEVRARTERFSPSAPRSRLEAELAAVNDALSVAAVRIADRIQPFPGENVTGLRIPGVVVPFYDQDADRLEDAGNNAQRRPLNTLESMVELVEAKLSEPEDVFAPEGSARRAELTRLLRDARDALSEGRERASNAQSAFQADVLELARTEGGPFHRRGPLRILEIGLAGALAAALAFATRRPGARAPFPAALLGATLLATAVVLLLEGTDLIPVDPVSGISLRFVPLAFGLGLTGVFALERLWQRALPEALAEDAAPERRPRPAASDDEPDAAPAPTAHPPEPAARVVASEREQEVEPRAPEPPPPFFSRPRGQRQSRSSLLARRRRP